MYRLLIRPQQCTDHVTIIIIIHNHDDHQYCYYLLHERALGSTWYDWAHDVKLQEVRDSREVLNSSQQFVNSSEREKVR